MTEVKIGSAGITAEFHAKGSLGLDGSLKLLDKIVFGNDLRDAPPDEVHLFIDGWEQFLRDSPVKFCFAIAERCHALHRAVSPPHAYHNSFSPPRLPIRLSRTVL